MHFIVATCFIFLVFEFSRAYTDLKKGFTGGHPSHNIRWDLNKISPRVIGGNSVAIEEYPFMVSITYFGNHTCGGTLLTYKHVLTAAHCVNGASAKHFKVRGGSSNNNIGGTVYRVARIYSHPEFDIDTFHADVAILKLKGTYSNLTVKTVELADKNESVQPETYGTVLGWGKTAGNGIVAPKLHKVALPVTARQYCRSVLVKNKVDEGMFCAGYIIGGKDTCQGDSGGPFLVTGKQFGITSWGVGCAEPLSPGVYTQISHYRDFIYSKIN